MQPSQTRRKAAHIECYDSLIVERRLSTNLPPLCWVALLLGALLSSTSAFLVVVLSFPVGTVVPQRSLPVRKRPFECRTRRIPPNIDDDTSGMPLHLFLARSSPSTKLCASSSTDDRQDGTAAIQEKKTKKTGRLRVAKKKKQQSQRGWDYRIEQLQAFCDAKGHCQVTVQHEEEFPGLYQWTRTIRSRYRHQVKQKGGQRDDNIPALASNSKEQQQPRFSSSCSFLPPEKLNQLQKLGFVWEPQEAAWKRRLSELQRFYAEFGHCRVPNNSLDYPGLGVWVRNQRREHGKLLAAAAAAAAADRDTKNTTSSNCKSTLTPARLRALEELDFEWYRSHRDAWQTRYEQLEEYYREHGHSNVPQPQTQYNENGERYAREKHHQGDDSVDENSAATKIEQLGNWCINQRTAYRNYLAGNPTALTPERIEKLEQLDFLWNVHQYKWQRMLERLKDYHRLHGHTNISVDDESNKDLRLWLILQRYLYNSREVATSFENANWKPSPLTEERIRALEQAVPQFSWKARASAGPSSKDWAQLFDAMRDKGLQPGMRPKQHWFEGINPFSINVKSTYTEQDLLELWYQDADDEEDDDEMDGMMG